MKDKIKKVSDIMKIFFGYGILVSLFCGGMIFFGYLVALIMGGDKAVWLCDFIYKKIVPVMIYFSTVSVLFGLLTMYLSGDKALTSGRKKKE